MSRPKFKSVFASEIHKYLDHQVLSGKTEISYYSQLRFFDKFCVNENINTKVFTKDHANKLKNYKKLYATTTFYHLINGCKNFLLFLSKKGYDVCFVKDIKFIQTQFKPHIYTDNEIKRYFTAVDKYTSSINRNSCIQYPILFRILYCCGTRINETLGIRKCDIDLETGVIKINEGKNNQERFIVLGDDLTSLMKQYANKCFHLLSENDFIFYDKNHKRLTGRSVYNSHRQFLREAGIPFFGESQGPRIHDWRHTMAVKSFKKLTDSGRDMYVALPIISTYLGHKTIYATERYVKLTMSMYPDINKRFDVQVKKIFRNNNKYEDN
ncbi:MAG: tyrosine-type recombinase/integrase [Clostridiales Family XIII bacterium]|jgi:integrase|nr:tyrosine-type recombinase/integrase [Clostridiales Family XIII bacterium]